LAEASLDTVRELIRSINFCNAKAINIIKTAQRLMAHFNGIVPEAMDDLLTLPGVGRKTANVVRGQAFGLPGITVDTHVNRLSNRLGFVSEKDPEKIEAILSNVWGSEIWSDFSTKLIVHGRKTCHARRPQCDQCIVGHLCPMIAKLS
jgi:endonuclease-3